MSNTASGLDRNYLEVSCQKSVDGTNFSQGVQDYNFSVGSRYSANLSKSYFRIGGVLRSAAGVPKVSDQIALADHWTSCLYDNVYMRAGGSDVSSITSFAGQAGVVKQRLTKGGAWLNTIGKSAYAVEPDFQTRVHDISSDGENMAVASKRVKLGPATATIAYTAASGTIAGLGGTLFNTNDIKVGDTLVILDAAAGSRRLTIVAKDTESKMFCETAAGANIAATAVSNTSYVIKANKGASQQSNEIYALWQPPIGVFSYQGGVLGSGDYRIQLNPRSDYKTACVEALTPLTVDTDYSFNITEVRFYLCIERSNIPADNIEKLYLNEIQVQTKTLATGPTENSLDFSVPPSTKQIAIFAQSNLAGSNTTFPLSKFKCLNDTDEDLRTIQLTYANVSKPSTNFTSAYNSGGTNNVNQMVQRYNDTVEASGWMGSELSSQTFDQWLKGGGIYLFDFNRDSEDRSVHLQLRAKFNNMADASRIFVVSFYTRVVEITTTSGYISNVVSMSV